MENKQANNFPETVTLDVTPELIADGVANDCELCPLALATKKLFPEYLTWVDTYENRIECVRIMVFEERTCKALARYLGEQDALSFIKLFDDEQPVEPGKFTFRLSWVRPDTE